MSIKKRVLENVAVGTELAKRTYLDDVMLEKDCDNCGSKMKHDLGSDYLSYPTVGSYQNIYMYCDECGTEYEEAMKVRIVLNLEIEED